MENWEGGWSEKRKDCVVGGGNREGAVAIEWILCKQRFCEWGSCRDDTEIGNGTLRGCDG